MTSSKLTMQRKISFPDAHTNGMQRVDAILQQQNLQSRPHPHRENSPYSYTYDRHIFQSPDLMLNFQGIDIAAENGWPESHCFEGLNLGDFDAWTYLLDESFNQITPSDLSPMTPDSYEPPVPCEKIITFGCETDPLENKTVQKKERRRAQNRKAQRRHRERREMTYCLTRTKVMQLESALTTAVEQEKLTQAENEILRAKLAALEAQFCSTEVSELVSPQDEAAYVFDTS